MNEFKVGDNLPCFKHIVAKIKDTDMQTQAAFAIAYLHYLERGGITDVSAISKCFQKITLMAQFNQVKRSTPLDLLKVGKKTFKLTDEESLNIYRQELFSFCEEPKAFKMLYKSADKKFYSCRFCPMAEDYTLYYRDKEYALAKYALADLRQFNMVISSIEDIDKLFISCNDLYEILNNVTKPFSFPGLQILFSSIYAKPDSYFNVLLQIKDYSFIKKGMIKGLKTCGLNANAEELDSDFDVKIYNFLLDCSSNAATLSDSEAMACRDELLRREKYIPPFDVESVPIIAKPTNDKCASGKKVVKKGKKVIECFDESKPALSNSLDYEMNLPDSPLNEYPISGSIETEPGADIPVPSDEEFKNIPAEKVETVSVDILSSDGDVILEHSMEENCENFGFDDDTDFDYDTDLDDYDTDFDDDFDGDMQEAGLSDGVSDEVSDEVIGESEEDYQTDSVGSVDSGVCGFGANIEIDCVPESCYEDDEQDESVDVVYDDVSNDDVLEPDEEMHVPVTSSANNVENDVCEGVEKGESDDDNVQDEEELVDSENTDSGETVLDESKLIGCNNLPIAGIDEESNSERDLGDEVNVRNDAEEVAIGIDGGDVISEQGKVVEYSVDTLLSPFHFNKVDLDYIDTIVDISHLDRFISYSLLDGFCIMEPVRFDDVEEDFVLIYSRDNVCKVPLSQDYLVKFLKNHHYKIGSVRVIPLYAMFADNGIKLHRTDIIIPLDRLLWSNQSSVLSGSVKEQLEVTYGIFKDTYMLDDGADGCKFNISDDEMDEVLLYSAYGNSFRRERFLVLPNGSSNAFRYDNDLVLMPTEFDYKSEKSKVSGTVFVFSYASVDGLENPILYQELTKKLLLRLAEKSCFNKFKLSVLGYSATSITFFSEEYCSDYIYNIVLMHLFKEGVFLDIRPLSVSLKKFVLKVDK